MRLATVDYFMVRTAAVTREWAITARAGGDRFFPFRRAVGILS
jgi:hypothetical protein